MKRIVVSLLVLFVTASCFAQPITRRAMDVNTVSDSRLQAEKNFFLPRYADTTTANLSKGIDSCGAAIFTYDNNTQWIRACNPKRWVKAAGSVVAANTNTVNLSGDGSTATPLAADVNLSTTGQNAIVALADGLYVPNSVRNGLVWGGAVTWVSGYTYSVAEAFYYINGAPFHSPTTTITLDPSDNDSSRIDLIVVNSQNLVAVVKGDLSTAPLEPTIDPSTQLRLSIVLVQAGTTEPTNNGTGLRRECIYQENTEWTTASSNARINPNSTNAPCVGSKDVEGTGVLNGDYVRFTRPSGNITLLDSFQVITFQLKSKAGWGNNRKLVLRWQNSGVNVGGVVNLTGTSYGWSSNLTGVCQTISIPLVDFGLPAGASVNQLLITASMSNGSIGFYLDQMCLQNQQQPNYATPITLQNGLNLDANTNIGELGGTLLHNTTNYTAGFVHTLSGASVYNYPYQFQQAQSFANGTGVASFHNAGALYNTSPDYLNRVRLGVNYTSDVYNTSPATEGYFGDRVGYMVNTNLRGHGSFGLYQDDSSSKNVGIFFHTKDNAYTDGVTIFAGAATNTTGDYPFAGLKTHKAAIFKTTGALQLPKYGIGTFTGTAAYVLGVDASGNVVETSGSGLTAITADNGLTANTSSNVQLGGTLLQNTTIAGSTFRLTISGSNTIPLLVSGTNNQAAKFVGASVGTSTYGTSIPVWSINNGTTTNSIVTGLSMVGAPEVSGVQQTTTNGFGVELKVDMASATTSTTQASGIRTVWNNVTAGSLATRMDFYLRSPSTFSRKASISSTGQFTLDGYGSGTQTGTPTYGLSVDASGNVIEAAAGIAAITANNGLTASTSTNVQLGGSALLSNTSLLTSAYSLTIPSSSSSQTLRIDNTGSGKGIYVQTSNDDGVNIGVLGGGTGVNAISVNGAGASIQSENNVAANLFVEPSSTNSVVTVMRVVRLSTGAAANGIGGSIDYLNETSSGTYLPSTLLKSKWTDVVDATRSSQFEIWGVNSAVSAVKFIVKANGIINIPTAPPSYANNAAAITGGLSVGDLYLNGDALQIVH